MRTSFRNFLQLNILALVILPPVILGLFNIRFYKNEMEHILMSKNFKLVKTVGKDIEEHFGAIVGDMELFLRFQETKPLDRESLGEHAFLFLERHPVVKQIVFVDPHGTVRESFPNAKMPIADFAGNIVFRTSNIKGSIYWSTLMQNDDFESSELTVSIPHSRGVVLLYLDLTKLKRVLDYLNLNRPGIFVLFDRNGNIIAQTENQVDFSDRGLFGHSIIRKGLGGIQVTEKYSYGSEEYLGSVAVLNTTKWIIAVIQPVRDAYAGINQHLILLMSISASVIVLAILMIAVILSRTLTPLNRLKSYAYRVSRGEYDVDLEANHFSEFRLLEEAFGTMITTIKARESSLIKSEKRLKVLLDNLSQQIFYKDRDFRYMICNDSFARGVGLSQDDILGKSDFELFTEDKARLFRDEDVRLLETGETLEINEPVTEKGEARIYHVIKSPVRDGSGEFSGILGILFDLTGQFQMQEQIWSLRKFESMASLAGGAAHDFNNILTVINGIISLIKGKVEKDSPIRDLLLSADKCVNRGTDLSKKLIHISKGDLPVFRETCIAEFVRDVAENDTIGSPVMLKYQCEPGLWSVHCDRVQIQQVISNLVINAVQAMPGGGLLKVTLGNIDNSEGTDKLLMSCRYVRIQVEDTGNGMTPEVQKRIFDPYFTTKKQGNGLGMATVFSIIRKHRGDIKCHSEPGIGTSFQVSLPVNDQNKQDEGDAVG